MIPATRNWVFHHHVEDWLAELRTAPCLRSPESNPLDCLVVTALEGRAITYKELAARAMLRIYSVLWRFCSGGG
jgi:hypothetical protein